MKISTELCLNREIIDDANYYLTIISFVTDHKTNFVELKLCCRQQMGQYIWICVCWNNKQSENR